MTTAFVLSGGGSLGAVQVGMLQALTERQVSPDLLVGTSAGALNAAFVAGRGTGHAALRALAESWASVQRRDIFPLQPMRHLLAFAAARGSLCSEDGLRRLIAKHLTFSRLEDAAIPGVFPPVAREDQILVDGGLADNAAISQAVALGAERVFVLPTGYACALTEPPRRPVGVALQALGLLIQQRLINDVALYADRVELIVLPPLCPLDVSPVDFSQSRDLIDRARHVAGVCLDGENPSPRHPERLLSLHHHSRDHHAPTPTSEGQDYDEPIGRSRSSRCSDLARRPEPRTAGLGQPHGADR